MPLKMTNNATSLLSSSIGTTETVVSITGGDEGTFPTFGTDEWSPITVTKSTGEREIMKCTGRSGVNLTVVRGQEGTTPLIFTAGQARVDVRLTAAAITEIAIQDRIYSIPADMSVGFRTASNRFVWNDKKDLTGTDVANIDEFGAFTTTKTITASGLINGIGDITAGGILTAGAHVKSNGYFLGGTLAMLSPTTAGTCYLRPNLNNNNAGEFTVDINGLATVNGALKTNGTATATGMSESGQVFRSTGVNAIFSCAGAASGALYFRPRNWNDDTGRMLLDNAGNLTTWSTGGFYSGNGHFHSNLTNCYLSAANGGQIVFRPNGTT